MRLNVNQTDSVGAMVIGCKLTRKPVRPRGCIGSLAEQLAAAKRCQHFVGVLVVSSGKRHRNGLTFFPELTGEQNQFLRDSSTSDTWLRWLGIID